MLFSFLSNLSIFTEWAIKISSFAEQILKKKIYKSYSINLLKISLIHIKVNIWKNHSGVKLLFCVSPKKSHEEFNQGS